MLKNLSRTKKILFSFILLLLFGVLVLNSKSRPKLDNQKPLTPVAPNILSNDPELRQLKSEKFSFSPNLEVNHLPISLPVFTASKPPNPNLQVLTNQMVQLFNLIPIEKVPNYYSTPDKSMVFHVDVKNNYAAYTVDGQVNKNAYLGNNPPKTTAAILAGKKFISSFSEFQLMEGQEESLSYFVTHTIGDDYEQVSNPAEANLITIPYSYMINGIPYRYISNITPPALVTVGQNNQVVRAIFSSHPLPDLSEETDTPIKTMDEVLIALNSNQGTVINAPLYNFPAKIDTLPPTEITNIKIEYRYDPQTVKVVPYFLISGNFIPDQKNATPITIHLLLPAVSL